MTAKVVYADKAKADVRQIWLYLAERNLPAADGWIDELDRAEKILLENPLIGVQRTEFKRSIRGWPMQSGYTIFYSVRGRRLTIFRILHHARDIRRFFG